jgi:hypothetical protein
MSIGSQIQRQEEQLERDLESGIISQRDFNEAMRELQRDYRQAVEEEAERAREDVYDRHGWR